MDNNNRDANRRFGLPEPAGDVGLVATYQYDRQNRLTKVTDLWENGSMPSVERGGGTSVQFEDSDDTGYLYDEHGLDNGILADDPTIIDDKKEDGPAENT